jgi:DNA (cytosine-5)-methyltransferase 1
MNRLTCIDLFCGCGGFSLGMQRAGFNVLAAIDFNPEAIEVFRTNLPSVPNALQEDLTKFSPDELAQLIEKERVDVIVGGPPCQGFSTVRQRDGANNGPRMVADERRHLYRDFLRFVKFFRPKVFVMENVLGIRSAAGGRYFSQVQQEARAQGYRVHPQVERAFELGVPQKRQRQLIIGTRLDVPGLFPGKLRRARRAVDRPTLGEAIGDLPTIPAGGGTETADYDLLRRKSHITKYGEGYLFGTLEAHHATKLTAHRARPHSARDLRDFARLREGEHCATAMKRGILFEFPYSKDSFKDRYTRQDRNQPCSTIVAHLSKDGLMFIHPTQDRSLTPREAARIQSFPDWFEFPVARTHQYRVIGNAVPPLVAEAVGLAVKSYLEKSMNMNRRSRADRHLIPNSEAQAIERILVIVRAAEDKSLQAVASESFLQGWYAIAFLYPGLHPDGALEHGEHVTRDVEEVPEISRIEPRLLAPKYAQSGWPVVLGPVAEEAWRRFDAGELREAEFYPSDATIAGMRSRDPRLWAEVG